MLRSPKMHWCCDCVGVPAHVCLAAGVWSWEGGRRNLQETSTSKTRKPFLNNLCLPEPALDLPISFFRSGERWRFRVYILHIYIELYNYVYINGMALLFFWCTYRLKNCFCCFLSLYFVELLFPMVTEKKSGWMDYKTIHLSVKCIWCFCVKWRGLKMDSL